VRMRLPRWLWLAAALWLGCAALTGDAGAQDAQVLLPEQSATKAKEVLQEAIQGMGGSAFLNARNFECMGHFSQFGHSQDMTGYETFYDYMMFPDKDRTEFSKKRNIINTFNGDKGWTLDKSGVSPAPESDIKRYLDDLQTSMVYILRSRLNEKGMIYRYSGPDVVDLKEVDWVEILDSQSRTIRIAVAKLTHLPVRKEVSMRDPDTKMKVEEVEIYSNYQTVDGIQVPYSVTRTRNGLKVYQLFYDSCKYNTDMSASLFTKESLEDRWDKVGKKKKK
jgi:hypothetical protein